MPCNRNHSLLSKAAPTANITGLAYLYTMFDIQGKESLGLPRPRPVLTNTLFSIMLLFVVMNLIYGLDKFIIFTAVYIHINIIYIR